MIDTQEPVVVAAPAPAVPIVVAMLASLVVVGGEVRSSADRSKGAAESKKTAGTEFSKPATDDPGDALTRAAGVAAAALGRAGRRGSRFP